jgi:hypothetical protein
MWKKAFRIAFWVFVIVTTLPLVLIFIKPSLPDVASTPEAAKSYDEKMVQLNESGPGKEVRFTEVELNSKIQESLGDMGQTGGPVALKSLTVHLVGNQLDGVFRVDAVGVSLDLLIGGTLGESAHRLVFNPTKMALGRLPVPVSLVGPSLRDRLNSPDLQSLFALPDNVRSVRIENGELIFETE